MNSNMGSSVVNGVGVINDGQRDCLRLVIQHKTSKDIARELNISPHTVDMRLRKAMTALGVETRMAAALLIAEADNADEQYQRLIYQPHGLPKVPGNEEESVARLGNGSSRANQPSSDKGANSVGINPQVAGGEGLPPVNERHSFRLAAAAAGGYRNHLSIGVRVALFVVLVIGSIIAFGVIVSALNGLKQLT